MLKLLVAVAKSQYCAKVRKERCLAVSHISDRTAVPEVRRLLTPALLTLISTPVSVLVFLFSEIPGVCDLRAWETEILSIMIVE